MTGTALHAGIPRELRNRSPFESGRGMAGYRIRSVLGRGRHSVVYLALQPWSGRTVALKVAQASPRGGPCAGRDLMEEFSALVALAHPNVIQAYDHGLSQGDAFLAIEYAAGGHLAQHGGPATPVATLSLLTQAARALAWLHQQGWVHRDVKPANLLLRSDGSLALADFGCAARRGEAGAVAERVVVGTPRYAAPEQSQGAPAAPTEDVYALGACLYEMLCGRSPYPGETLIEQHSQHLLAPLPRLAPQVCAWQPLLDAMLAKDPRKRLADGHAVLRQLGPIQDLLHRGPEQDTRNPS